MLGDILAEKLLINNGMDDDSALSSKGGGYGDGDDGDDNDGELCSDTDSNDLTDEADPSKLDRLSINLFPETSNDHMNNADTSGTQSTILFDATQQNISTQDHQSPTITPIVHNSRPFDYGSMDHWRRQQTGNGYTAWNKNVNIPMANREAKYFADHSIFLRTNVPCLWLSLICRVTDFGTRFTRTFFFSFQKKKENSAPLYLSLLTPHHSILLHLVSNYDPPTIPFHHYYTTIYLFDGIFV
jgi:hypothetical protein